ncbi:hypothetical protein ACRAWG_23305 [Methylobacterium sp. P31]
MHPGCRLFLGVLTLVPLTARAGEFAQAPPAPGMALTLPDPGMANSAPAPTAPPEAAAPPPQVDPLGERRRFGALGSGFPSLEGRLPNQRTGPRREHVVRDICIGC